MGLAWLGALATLALATRDPAAAEALFRQGREAMKRGDHAAACAKFTESQRLDPAPGTLLNLAECQERLGKVATAWQALQEAVERLPPGDERVPLARTRAAALLARAPHLVITLARDAPAGTRVLRDGIELGPASLGVALPTDPGRHEIEVQAPGRRPERVTVALAERERRTVLVAAGPALPPPPPPAPAPAPAAARPAPPPPPVTTAPARAPAPPAARSRPLAGWIAGGVGAAGLATWAVTGLLWLDRKDTVDRAYDPQRVCSPEGRDAGRSGRTLGTVNTVALGVGLVGAGVGAYLLLGGEPRREPRVALVPLDGGAAAVVAGCFR